MHTIFQTETGGYITFTYKPEEVTHQPLLFSSGYVDVVSQRRAFIRFDGFVESGLLHVPKSTLAASLTPGMHLALPQLLDEANNVYFLDPEDIRIVEVPSFFDYAALTPASSLLARLTNLEGASFGYTSVEAAESIHSGALVSVINGLAYKTDCTSVTHKGFVVGFALESTSAGSPVNVRSFGTLVVEYPLFSAFVHRTVFAGVDGFVQTVPLVANTTFIQSVGVVQDPYTLFIHTGAVYTV